MKKLLKSGLILSMIALLLCTAGCSKKEEAPAGSDAATYDITVWVSEVEGMADLTKAQIDKFNETSEDVKFNATIEGISEADAATLMITDVESGADIY